jgi:hypothetical protein
MPVRAGLQITSNINSEVNSQNRTLDSLVRRDALQGVPVLAGTLD